MKYFGALFAFAFFALPLGAVALGDPADIQITIAASPPLVRAGEHATLTWSVKNASSCEASGAWRGSKKLEGKESVGSSNGEARYILTCNAGDGRPLVSGEAVVETVAPASADDFFQFTVRVSRVEIQRGESVEIAWNALEATSCTADGDDTWQSSSISTQGSRVLSPQKTTLYVFECRKGGVRIEKTAVITVRDFLARTKEPASFPEVDFFPNQTNVARGQKVILSWKARGAHTCEARSTLPEGNVWYGEQSLEGATSLVLPEHTRFGIVCSTPFQISTRVDFVIAVRDALPLQGAKPTLVLRPLPREINYGDHALFEWESRDAIGCSLRPVSFSPHGLIDTKGTLSIKAIATTILTLGCWSESGDYVEKEIMLRVASLPQVQLTFEASEDLIAFGDEVVLRWSAAHAVRCDASGGWVGQKPTSGEEIVKLSGGPTIYGLSCIDALEKKSVRSLEIGIATPLRTDAVPSLEFWADKTNVKPGQPVILQWNARHMDRCQSGTISFDENGNETWGEIDDWQSTSQKHRGTKVIVPTKTVKYFLYCTGSGMRIKKTAKVFVSDALPQETPADARAEVRLLADYAETLQGSTMYLFWKTANVRECEAVGAWNGHRDPQRAEPTAVTVEKSGSYGLECSNIYGYTTRVDINILARPVGGTHPQPRIETKLTAQRIDDDNPASNLFWTTSYTSGCAGRGADDFFEFLPLAGMRQLAPLQSTTYIITCWSRDGIPAQPSAVFLPVVVREQSRDRDKAARVPLGISAPADQTLPRTSFDQGDSLKEHGRRAPDISLRASASHVKHGTFVTIEWKSNGARTCAGYGAPAFVGKKSLLGSQKIRVIQNDYYVLRCENGAGRSTRFLYVTQNGKAPYRAQKLPRTAFRSLSKARAFALPLTVSELTKIPFDPRSLEHGHDTDGDGVSDAIEEAFGTYVFEIDTDHDGFSDAVELLHGYSPLRPKEKYRLYHAKDNPYRGQFIIQTDSRGELWYVHPRTGKLFLIQSVKDIPR